jgi:Acyl-CoA synthetases (AMP-forming)/AMP-acid ligases II
MDAPWFSRYPKGTPQQIGPYDYQSLIELFEDSVNKFPNRVAFENFGKQITFREIDDLSTAFAAYLQQDLKLKKGDRIAIQMPNLIQFPIAFMGAIKAGLIAVNTNPLYTPREMEYQFNDAAFLPSSLFPTLRIISSRSFLKFLSSISSLRIWATCSVR